MPADLRIGELTRRTGVSPELLRAWERRYVGKTTAAALARRISARQAAELALGDGDDLPGGDSLVEALVAFDDVGAQTALDRLLSSLTLETVLREAVLPTLHELGERWERDEITIGQEHFASNLIRGR